MDNKSRVYIRLDDQNRIIGIEGEYTLPQDLTDWILLEEGEPCDRLNLAQSHYLPKGLTSYDGIYRYKYVNGSVEERTPEEMEADRVVPLIEPTLAERLNDLEIALCEIVDTLAEA